MGFHGLMRWWLVFAGFLCCCEGFKFIVGGKGGWVEKPSEEYNQWAGRNRFQVNDTLFFKYQKGVGSVLVVAKDDYFSCNTEKPIMKMDDGESEFKFDRSGPFFFISGNKTSCDHGQKLIVVVLSPNHFKPHPAVPPASPPKSASPGPSLPPASSPNSPSPVANAPTPAKTPELSPTPAHSPEQSPAPSPQPNSPTTSPNPSSPTSSPPVPATTPSSPSTSTPATSPSASTSTPASIISPAPTRSSATVIAPSTVTLSSVVITILIIALGRLY
ncbi:hypothetical protein PVL29_025356 [Vitis rotundifolia]|uniref:Phytocyanin domain-containing protein n=1 Tax=Vitis rotundifolia TaxID=103349 RepID=A0AA39D720_VITRO|nr:hypothetical protein PVL29_025356 [Vitis rotundifolia]